jgi:hypothetical protein
MSADRIKAIVWNVKPDDNLDSESSRIDGECAHGDRCFRGLSENRRNH